MAERRMFAKTIIDSDAFLDMPSSSQLLYFHLGMRADDDGFVNSPKKIMRVVGCSDDDMKLLIAKKFVIPFESGVVVIKHWRIHNYIQKDRYKETTYKEEKAMLEVKENKAYRLVDTECIHDVSSLDTQSSLVKSRLGKDSLDKSSLVCPTREEVREYAKETESALDPDKFFDYYDETGWTDKNGEPINDWKKCFKGWERRENVGLRNQNTNGSRVSGETGRCGNPVYTVRPTPLD